MKIVYLKVEDPIAWKKPEAEFYEEDKKLFTLCVDRVAGVLVMEDKETITIGAVSIAEDNKVLAEQGLMYPRYRYVMTVAKKNVKDRQDFEVKEVT